MDKILESLIDKYIKILESSFDVHYAGEMDYEMVFNAYKMADDGNKHPSYRVIMDIKAGTFQVCPCDNNPVTIDIYALNLYSNIMELAIDQLGQNEVKNS